jgi:hypothetical protein
MIFREVSFHSKNDNKIPVLFVVQGSHYNLKITPFTMLVCLLTVLQVISCSQLCDDHWRPTEKKNPLLILRKDFVIDRCKATETLLPSHYRHSSCMLGVHLYHVKQTNKNPGEASEFDSLGKKLHETFSLVCSFPRKKTRSSCSLFCLKSSSFSSSFYRRCSLSFESHFFAEIVSREMK